MSDVTDAEVDRPHLPAADGGALDGPWEQAFWFAVSGQVRSKANHRRGDKRAGGWAATQNSGFELEVSSAARRHRPAGWDPGSRADRVADRPQIVVYCFARSLLDAGNLDKSVLDALQGPVMVTDAQVTWTAGAAVRDNTSPGLVVALARLAPGGTVAAQAAAGCALAFAVTDMLQAAGRPQ